jgi:threonyl-tRNA synthetase
MAQHEHNLEAIRHSLAHLLAAAVKELYPNALPTIGPAIENGFYYDFDNLKISDADLPAIEAKMRELLPNWKEFTKEGMAKGHALAHPVVKNNKFKQELLEEIAERGEGITFYTSGGFTDLCRGGHAERPSKEIKANSFKLSHLAGAYWRGDSNREQLTRIYGLAFGSKKELDEYIARMEEAKKRDHKKLGVELDLFTFSELVGPGLPLFTPKGTIVRDGLDAFVWELRKAAGYERVDIPHLARKELYVTSGHWEKFKDDLFTVTTREKHFFAMKPMNCPHHAQIYARRQWSYRELPQRYASTTKVYRDEQSGELAGLSRVRSITQDDAHVFCRKSQIEAEMGKVWDIIERFYGAFGFELAPRLSLHDPKHPEKYLGTREVWHEAETILRKIAKSKKAECTEAPGEAAFYGPKIDFMAKDSIGREWQVATIQLDMNQPERFNLTCIGEDGKAERIFMIHAAIMGAIERFMAVLIEHTAGAFPLWLAPVQVRILAISDKFQSYAEKVNEVLKEHGIRSEVSGANETLGKRIRQAELEKIPYTVVVGEKELEAKTVNVRSYATHQTNDIDLEKFIEALRQEVKNLTV